MLQSPGDDTARLTLMFELTTGRKPSEREWKVLQQSLDYHRQNFSQRDDEIARLMAIGEARPTPALNSAEVAAYTAIANLVLNLDEVITKE